MERNIAEILIVIAALIACDVAAQDRTGSAGATVTSPCSSTEMTWRGFALRRWSRNDHPRLAGPMMACVSVWVSMRNPSLTRESRNTVSARFRISSCDLLGLVTASQHHLMRFRWSARGVWALPGRSRWGLIVACGSPSSVAASPFAATRSAHYAAARSAPPPSSRMGSGSVRASEWSAPARSRELRAGAPRSSRSSRTVVAAPARPRSVRGRLLALSSAALWRYGSGWRGPGTASAARVPALMTPLQCPRQRAQQTLGRSGSLPHLIL
jgi:hypothetical protein